MSRNARPPTVPRKQQPAAAQSSAAARLLLAERPRPRRIAAWPHAHWLAVATVCLGAFLGQLTASVTALVFPALEQRFDASFAAVEWVSLGYLLVLVALLAPVGRLSDAVGRKTVYLGGFAVFTAASIGAGLSGSLGALVAWRALQAVGGAMLQANSVALVARGVPERSMRTALGVQAAAQALGLALGPALGGLLVSHADWRWAFWINVPVGVVGILAGHYLLPRTPAADAPGPRAAKPAGFDLAGLLLLAGASTALLLALSTASGLPLPGWAAAALLCSAAALAHALVRHEKRAARPLLDPALLRAPGVRTGLVVALVGYLLLFCPLVLGPLMLAGSGGSAAHVGVVITALPAAFAVAATAGGALLPRGWSDAKRSRAGALAAAVGLALFAALPTGTGEAVGPLLLTGAGLGLLLPANNALVMRAFPVHSSAVGGGMLNTVRSLGTALGTALPVLGVHLAGRDAGGRAVLVLLVGAAVLSAALAAPPVPRPGR